MSERFTVKGWKAGETYEQECAGYHTAQMYIVHAQGRGFFDVHAVDETGKR
jgi:hypothetical protein